MACKSVSDEEPPLQVQHPSVSKERMTAGEEKHGPRISAFITTTNDARAVRRGIGSPNSTKSCSREVIEGGRSPLGGALENNAALSHSETDSVNGQRSQMQFAGQAQSSVQVASGEGEDNAGEKDVEDLVENSEAGSDREGERLYSQDKTTKSCLQGRDETSMSSNIFITVDSCIIYSKDKISMGKSHIINFVSREWHFKFTY